MVGFIALDLVARVILARMKDVAFAAELLSVDPSDSAADAPSLGVPTDMIVDLEPSPHLTFCHAVKRARKVPTTISNAARALCVSRRLYAPTSRGLL